jgi:hypothetical protein
MKFIPAFVFLLFGFVSFAQSDSLARVQRQKEMIWEDSLRRVHIERERFIRDSTLSAKHGSAIVEGDRAFANRDFSQAKAKYTEAISYWPGDPVARQKILEADKMIAREADYKMLMAQAAYFKRSGNYAIAYIQFSQMLSKFPDQSTFIEQQLVIAHDSLMVLDKDSSYMAAYHANLFKADSCLAVNNYEMAYTYYRFAYEKRPHDVYAKNQHDKCELEVYRIRTRKDCDRYIELGDSAMGEYRFHDAIDYYSEVMRLDTADKITAVKYQEAQNMRQQLWELDLPSVSDHFRRGIISNEEVIEAYKKGLAIIPIDTYMQERLAWHQQLATMGILNCNCDELAQNEATIRKKIRHLSKFKTEKRDYNVQQCGYYLEGVLFVGLIIYPTEGEYSHLYTDSGVIVFEGQEIRYCP